jgi:uncharacterized protein (DUF1501 family)
MKRRDFIRTASAASAGPLLLGGVPVFANPANNLYSAWAASSQNDRVMVIVQLHGGNDGLNTVIPINNYGMYYNVRPNIAIPQNGARKFITLDDSLGDNQKVGLHTDMTGAKAMYDEGNMAVVQNVSYENLSGSHFRSRDVWFMGGDYDEYLSSSWMGRYLEHYYPNYPDAFPSAEMPDPLAIEIGSGLSLAFHQSNGFSAALGIQDPVAFHNLINSVGTEPLINFPDNYAGDELRYIMGMERQGNVYADRLRDVYLAGSNSPSVIYPQIYPYLAPQSTLSNGLAPQLKIISRLLSGGCKTKIFLCRIGGFDTHANQVLQNDTTMGSHAALLYHISSAVQAFHKDLQAQGLGDKVVTATISEFGRRIPSNASYGTDHGNAAPLFVFGNCVKGGVFGTNPTFSDLQQGNLPMQIDYRQVMTALAMDWMGADISALQHIAFTEWIDSRLDIIECKAASISENKTTTNISVSPNPTANQSAVNYKVSESDTYLLTIYTESGIAVTRKSLGYMTPGNKTLTIETNDWAAGVYIVTILGRNTRLSVRLVVVR